MTQLWFYQTLISTTIDVETKLPKLRVYNLCQYGFCSYSSDRRHITGLAKRYAKTNFGNVTWIWRLLTKGSSNWILGQNNTRTYYTVHAGRKSLNLPNLFLQNVVDRFDLYFHWYEHMSCFVNHGTQEGECTQASSTTIHKSTTEKISSCRATCRLVDKVHKHVCGHSTYGYMKTLFINTNCRQLKRSTKLQVSLEVVSATNSPQIHMLINVNPFAPSIVNLMGLYVLDILVWDLSLFNIAWTPLTRSFLPLLFDPHLRRMQCTKSNYAGSLRSSQPYLIMPMMRFISMSLSHC